MLIPCMGNVQELPVSKFVDIYVKNGEVCRPGDGVGIVYLDHVGLLQQTIRFVQRRALADLLKPNDGKRLRLLLEASARCTHWACVVDNVNTLGEMTSPHARLVRWEQYVDNLVWVRRHIAIHLNKDIGKRVADRFIADADNKVDYPESALLYYGRWLRHAWTPAWGKLRKRIYDLFPARDRQVCGPRWMYHLQTSGVEIDGRPEFWYPGRLAWDQGDLFDVTCCVLRKG